MATEFSAGSVISSSWLNAVDRALFGIADDDSAMRRVISLNRFPGIDPTGRSDSSPGFKQAVALAQARGHCTLFLDPGRYRLSEPIEFSVPAGPAARRDLPSLVGGGMNGCVLLPTFSGPAIRVRGLPPANGSGQQSGTYFFWGGTFSHFTIDGSLAPKEATPFPGGATDGIELLAVWHAWLHHLRFVRLRHGVTMPSDLEYNPNPDWSAPAKSRVDHCSFERLQGWGLFNPHVQGAPSWTVEENVFTLLGAGGILCKSSDWEIKKNGFGGMGWVDETVPAGSVDGCCIEYDGAVTANSKHSVHGNEFDGARGASVRLINCGPSAFHENRHITRHQALPGAVSGQLSPPRAFAIAPNANTNAVRGVRAVNEIIRVEHHGTFTYADFVNAANVANVTFDSPTISDQSGGTATVNLQTGATVANLHVRQNFKVLGADARRREELSGRPPPTFLGKLAGTPASPTTETTLVFDAPDAVMNQVWPNLMIAGTFLAPASAWYAVHVRIAVQAQAQGELHELRLVVDGVVETVDLVLSPGAVRVFPELTARVWANRGQAIEVKMISSVSRLITGAHSRLLIEQR